MYQQQTPGSATAATPLLQGQQALVSVASFGDRPPATVPSAPPAEPLTKKEVVSNLIAGLLPDAIYGGGVAVAAFLLRGQADLSITGTSAASVALNTFIVSRVVKGGMEVALRKSLDDANHAVKTQNDALFYGAVFAGVLAVAAATAGVAGMLDVNSPIVRKAATYVAPIVASIMSEVCPELYAKHLARQRHEGRTNDSAVKTIADLTLKNLGSAVGVITAAMAAYTALSNPSTSVSYFTNLLALGFAGNIALNSGNQLRVMRDEKLLESPQLDIEFAISKSTQRLFTAAYYLRYFAVILAQGATIAKFGTDSDSSYQTLANVGIPLVLLMLQLSVTFQNLAQEEALREQRKALGEKGGPAASSLEIVELDNEGHVKDFAPEIKSRLRPSA